MTGKPFSFRNFAGEWLRTLRAPNLQLAVELTDAGRGIAEPLYQ